MFATIVIVIFALIGLAILIFGPKVQTDAYRLVETSEGLVREYKTVNTKPAAILPLLIAALILFFSATASVQAKQVGVVTTFGKTSETTLNSGFHFKAPWQKVTQIDATIQTDEYNGKNCITVILADKNTACISTTNRWSVNRENANEVYADFRSDNPTKSLRDAVVSTQFKSAVNTVFSTYDASNPKAADTDALAGKVEELMLGKTDDLVDIKDVTISYIKLGEKAQSKIDQYQSQVAKTRIADEQKATASKEAEANRILSNSISNDPNVLVSKCLDMLADNSFTAPAGFTCWPGSGSAIVVPSK